MEKQIKENVIVLEQVLSVLRLIDQEQFNSEIDIFGGSALGHQFRHILEFYLIFLDGVETGLVSYDKRIRNKQWEQSIDSATMMFNSLIPKIKDIKADKLIELEYGDSYGEKEYSFQRIQSTIKRELSFVVEHSIHHLAMIKMGMRHVFPEIEINKVIGVAPSTIKYQSNVHTDVSSKK